MHPLLFPVILASDAMVGPSAALCIVILAILAALRGN
jgi:hypothetical protein